MFRFSSLSISISSRLNTKSVIAPAVLFGTSLFLTACATPVGEVANWAVTNAEEQFFAGTVVDVMCELNGNCAENCGNGARQLAIKTEEFGTVFTVKNINNYTGATDELSPFCNQTVEVNGLFTEHRGVRFFQVHNVRAPGGQWRRANRYAEQWASRYGKTPGQAANWQSHDDRVKDVIGRDGVLGLGLEADKEFLN